MKLSKFERDEKYMQKLFLLGIAEKDVHTDAEIVIKKDYHKRKLRAYCPLTNTWLQFPNKLRQEGIRYIADIYRVPEEGETAFYRAVTGSIRLKGSDVPLA